MAIDDSSLLISMLWLKFCCRIGNLLMPEENYSLLEEWMKPILKQMLLEQNTQVGLGFGGFVWFFLLLCTMLKKLSGSRYSSSSVAPETQFFFQDLFLEQKPDEKYTFFFYLLGSSLDPIKGDPPIRQRDQPPWFCLLLGLQGEPCTHPSGIAMTQMYMKRKWLNSCINYYD